MEPKVIAERAAKLGFPAVALNDRNGLYAAMAFTEACIAKGVQPIVGAMLAVARPPETGSAGVDWLVLLAKDEQGYGNLCHLVSSAHLDRPVELDPHVPFAALEKANEGLIALTAGSEGALGAAAVRRPEGSRPGLSRSPAGPVPGPPLHRDHPPQRPGRRGCRKMRSIELAFERNLPLVATNPAAYSDPSFHAAHDAMLCIAQSAYIESNDRQTSSPEAWLKDSAAIAELFVDLPEALANTAVIARRCAVGAPKRRPILPRLSDQEDEQLRADAHAGLDLRLAGRSEEDKAPYRERLDFEIDVITRMGFAGYFLIVADFIKWAKAHDIPVGPGRGSGAGSVVAWALTITDLDPLALNLLFERFLNPERVSMPDFDIDFCETRRDEVISYVQQKYGRDRVAQIITFGRLKARAVLKDTGRVLQMSYGHVDRLAKMIPNHPTDPWTLERSLNGVSELAAEYKADSDVKRLIDLAMKLEGLPRHASTHAAGVVIGDRRLDDLVPMYRDPRSDMPVTQFDMKYVEAAGLVKFDFLGLKTLSVLKEAERLLAEQGVDVDFTKLTWDDPEVYELLQRGDTVGVFQLESEGMRRTLAAVRPTGFGDIIALVVALPSRPDGQHSDVRRPQERPRRARLSASDARGGAQGDVRHLRLPGAGDAGGAGARRLLARRSRPPAPRHGQEDPVGDGRAARPLRRGLRRHTTISAGKANELFDLIDKFAGYGFNKSHAAAYALVAYQTAWLKAHHRPEFYAASMSFDMTQTDKLALFVEDMRRGEIECLPPDINASQAAFSVEDGKVRYALGALKGVGEKAMEALVAEREAKGPFKSLDDFAERIDPRLLNRRQIESLAAAGAFDSIAPDRAAVLPRPRRSWLMRPARPNSGRAVSMACSAAAPAAVAPIRLAQDGAWSLAQRMAAERDAFGFYFSAHPVDSHRHLLEANKAKTFAELADIADAGGGRAGATMAGLVEEARWRMSAKGRRYLMATLSDSSGQFQASIFDDEASAAVEAAAKARTCGLLTVELDKRPGDELPRVAIKRFQPLETAGEANPASDGRTRFNAVACACDRSRAVEFTRRRRDGPLSSSRCRRAAKRSSWPAATSRSTPSSRPGSSASQARGASTSPSRSRRSSPSSAEAHAIQKPSALTRPVIFVFCSSVRFCLKDGKTCSSSMCACFETRARNSRTFSSQFGALGPMFLSS